MPHMQVQDSCKGIQNMRTNYVKNFKLSFVHSQVPCNTSAKFKVEHMNSSAHTHRFLAIFSAIYMFSGVKLL